MLEFAWNKVAAAAACFIRMICSRCCEEAGEKIAKWLEEKAKEKEDTVQLTILPGTLKSYAKSLADRGVINEEINSKFGQVIKVILINLVLLVL